jgi:hypothetical protein
LTKQGERDQSLGRIKSLEGELDEYHERFLECESKLGGKEKEISRLGGLQQTELEALKEREREA